MRLLVAPLGTPASPSPPGYSATELKPTTKKVDFLTKDIECTTPIPCNQSWSRAFKKVGVVHSIASNCEKSDAQGAKKFLLKRADFVW